MDNHHTPEDSIALKTTNTRPELIGLNGGSKNLWIKNHKEVILEYYAEHGLLFTLIEFNLQYDTFDRFIRKYSRESKLTGRSKAIKRTGNSDRAFILAQQALIANAELRREIREMREEYGQLVQLIAGQITANIIEALKSINIELPAECRSKDPLNLIPPSPGRELLPGPGTQTKLD